MIWATVSSQGNANNTFEYYLKGDGSVSYQAVSAANHKIKMADVTLSGGAKSVQSKTLVTFISTDYSQQKQDRELTVAQTMNSLLPNSDLSWRK